MDFVEAHELGDAFSTLDERGADAVVLAGGTDLMVQYLRGEIAPASFLHIRKLESLRGIELNGRTRVGALTTHWQLVSDARIANEHRSLAEAAARVGGRQTQNVGTVAGNVVNASPAADLLPPLLVADADVTLESSSGTRSLAVADFLVGRKETARRPDELVTGLSLERPAPRTGEIYLKVGRRRAMEVAVVGLAARLMFAEDGTALDARIAVCSVAPTPFRAAEAEAALRGTKLEDAALGEAGSLLAAAARPIDDARATAAYRRRVLAPLLRQAANACRARAGL